MKRLAVMLVASVLGATAAGAQAAGPAPRNRPVLEKQLRERVAEITRTRLGLDEAQMTKLETVNSRYAPQLGALGVQERKARQDLRRDLMAPAPDQAEVGKLLDDLLRLQKERMSLLESEQKDLSVFLTPVQRAKYMGLQSQIRRRADQLRNPNAMRQRGRAGKQPLR